jgi:hypothetical protein
MTKKLKAIITTTLIYEPNPEDYPECSKTPTIEEMATTDLEGLLDDCAWVSEDPNSETHIDVIVIED